MSDVDSVVGSVDVVGLWRLSGPLSPPFRFVFDVMQAELISWRRMQFFFSPVFQSRLTHLRISNCTCPPPPPRPPFSASTPLPCTDLAPSLSLEAVPFFFYLGLIQAFPLQEMFVI